MNANNPEIVKQAYEAGVRLFDTALDYQQDRNEKMIGDVLAQLGVRAKVVLQTKIPFPRVLAGSIKERFPSDFAGCLERLQTKYVGVLAMKTQTGGHAKNLDPLNQTAMLKWVRQHPEITSAIPGYTSFDQLIRASRSHRVWTSPRGKSLDCGLEDHLRLR